MSDVKFTRQDLDLIKAKGISLENIEIQLENFQTDFPPIELAGAAVPGKGIICLSKEKVNLYATRYENIQRNLQSVKFIPASGAASRMFKRLFEFLSDDADADIETAYPEIKQIVAGLSKMALKEDLEEVLQEAGMDLNELISNENYRSLISAIIMEDGLNYGKMPKGLIKFHKYTGENRTPVEEHLIEGAGYCIGHGENVSMHFTVSTEHMDGFFDLLDRVQSYYEKKYGVKYRVNFSTQRAITDTLAVDLNNEPFRDSDGNLLFSPGGHGALLANLNELDADLIFVKNIDNVSPDRLKPATLLYKKALAGILLEVQQKTFEYLRMLEEGDADESLQTEIRKFLISSLNYIPADADFHLSGEDGVTFLRTKLNRPMRVCGMVKNKGEPGGGPFWTRNTDESVSLQIVEASQINFKDPVQDEIFRKATHFNPVDLVCATRDYKGKAFDLHRFIDPHTGFISSKSRDGKKLRVQELPGLWNGSMADWNTLFIEVPLETFNPVKTINDLLRPEHLA